MLNSTRQAREKLSKSLEGTSDLELAEDQGKVKIVLTVNEISKAKQTMVDDGKIR